MFWPLAILMFAWANEDFLAFAQEYQDQGYTWEYVGKTKPSGVPAITMKANGEEYILWKLKK